MNNQNKEIFYSRAYLYFALAFLITVAGFFPSYFSRLGETSATHHFHGVTATLWMLLLVVQPLLYRLDKMTLHRMIGRSTLLLVPLIITGGLIMVWMMLNDERYPDWLAYRLAYIDFYVLIQFLLFYVLAIKNIKDTQYHARYMACTIFGPLIPAISRLLPNLGIADNLISSIHISYVLVEVVLIVLIADDKRRGRFRLPYILALGLMLLQHLTMSYAAEWSWWQRLMDAYGSIAF